MMMTMMMMNYYLVVVVGDVETVMTVTVSIVVLLQPDAEGSY